MLHSLGFKATQNQVAMMRLILSKPTFTIPDLTDLGTSKRHCFRFTKQLQALGVLKAEKWVRVKEPPEWRELYGKRSLSRVKHEVLGDCAGRMRPYSWEGPRSAWPIS
jgi:hypothetical protein